MSYNGLITIYTNLYDIMWSDVLPQGAVLLLQPVCVWINTKYNMNYYESSRIHQNEYELRWIISYDLYEFVWYYAEQRVATRNSLAFTVYVCVCVCVCVYVCVN